MNDVYTLQQFWRACEYYMLYVIFLSLTQLSDLSVEGAAHRSAMEGQPGETIMTHGMTTQQKTRDLIPLEREDVLTDATLEYLSRKTQLDGF